MIYKHQYFTLDTEARKVWDENGRELQITGKAFKVLVFLCENKEATVDEIGDFLYGDSERFYEYNLIRQHPNNANKIISRKVIKYENSLFFIDGKVEKLESKHIGKEEAPLANEKVQELENNRITPNNQKRKYAVAIVGAAFVIGLFSMFLFYRNHKSTVIETPKIEIAKPQDDMILIPAGDFLMGSTEPQVLDASAKCEEGKDCLKSTYYAEYPQHTVFVNDFYADKKGISNADYKLFVAATGYKEPPYWNDSNLNASNQPVVGVNFDDANAYCQWIGKRLPTEAEREKFARGADGRIYPWGNVWDPTKDNHGQGGMPGRDKSDGFEYSAPVAAEMGVSPFGVLNAAGNVWEWTTDDFNPYPKNDKYNNESFGKGMKVLRGGAFDEDLTQQRTASRYDMEAGSSDLNIGFRCVKDKI